uniref:Uncharacterized protein n=1 Tax=Oryzias sinensis TaxID=183150 RepID=A0A8C8DHS4_9TELE
MVSFLLLNHICVLFSAASPPLLTGGFIVTTQNEKVGIFGKYLYDAVGQRVRLFDIGSFKNKTFTADVLLHYSDAAMYEIDDAKQTCKKSPLKADFQPLKIPQDAFWLSQTVVGSSSLPGQGLLVNNWYGKLPDKSVTGTCVVKNNGWKCEGNVK